MSNCLCLACDRLNPITTKFCTQCGAKLQIQERYRALKVIGQGGFGKTFLSQDESKPSQPRCVIKQFAFETLNPNASQGTLDVAIRLFEQEAKRLDDLGKHPQIPELLSFTLHEGKQYLIQEFIDGETLEQELRRVGAFSEQQVRDVLVEVLQILEFVHSKSVIHRDISPDNIIRRRSDKKLVLVDFGAAKHATATLLAKTGTGIGKPSYGAPEQMLGKSVFQSDLFGLGVTCLHLLTNVEPFTLYDVLENEYQWRQFLNGKVVSDKFGKFLDRLTAYKVKERPNSVVEALQELGTRLKTSNPVNTSNGIYSFKSEELKAQHRASIPFAVPNKQATKTISSNNSVSNQNVAKFPSPPPVYLYSSENIDYSSLEYWLKVKNWQLANNETTKIMLKVSKREKEGWLDPSDIQNFPCDVLQTIDNLWASYSNKKFGFSVQSKLWIECGGKIGQNDYEIWQTFRNKVSHYNYEDTKLGQLPYYFRGGRNYEYGTIADFSKKITECDIAANPNLGRSKIELRSAKGIDYSELERLLQAKDWKASDELTKKLMLKIGNRENKGWLDEDSIRSFPCEDLRTINQLWVYNSNGKFGFGVQKKIWIEYGGKEFASRTVFPHCSGLWGGWDAQYGWGWLFSRIDACQMYL